MFYIIVSKELTTAQPKFDKDALHRRPEFDDSVTTTKPATAKPSAPPIIPKALGAGTYTPANNTSKPANALPPHMRPSAASTPLRNNVTVATKTGLSTPDQTPQGKSGPHDVGIKALLQASNASVSSVPQPRSILKSDKTPNHNQVTNKHSSVQPAKAIPVQQHQQKQGGPIPLNELDREDMYSFGSEDDAIFAEHLDLVEAEADFGRPIETDEGIGGAIDFDEGGPNCDPSLLSSSTNAKVVSHNARGQTDRNERQPGLIQATVAQVKSTSSDAQEAASAKLVRENENNSRMDDVDEISRQILALRRQKNAARSGTQTSQTTGQKTAAAAAGSNMNVPPVSKPSVNSVPPKPVLKSVGGFNFPSNMVCSISLPQESLF